MSVPAKVVKIEIYLSCSVAPIPFATMTNREWGSIGNNYLKGLFALGVQGFFIMVCVGIYAVLVNEMVIAANLHSAIFSIAVYTVILCFFPCSKREALQRASSTHISNDVTFINAMYTQAIILCLSFIYFFVGLVPF